MFGKNLVRILLLVVVSLIALAVVAINAVAQTPQQAAQPPASAILRVETGMHIAVIHRIGVDEANRYLVTASEDKTARVWELATGRLLRVLRPPVGKGDEGKLYSVAISPDGRTVTVGGWTSPNGLDTSIYLFDRETGRMVRRIAGLPGRVYHLVYSHDGRWLAATLSDKNGIRVYETGGYTLVGEDKDYGERTGSADFDAAGRLVSSSFDGFIRLYDRSEGGALRLAAKRKAKGGELPCTVSFRPDGSYVAVGFYDSTNVAVLSASNLSLRYAPDTRGVSSGDLRNVAWSADGQVLSAGGRYDFSNSSGIRQWADGGRTTFRDVVASLDTVMQILPLRDGSILYCAGDPAFGRIDAAGKRVLFVGPAIANYQNNKEGFLTTSDGAIVQFSYEAGGKSPVHFSLVERRLDEATSTAPTLKPPLTSGIDITDWHNNEVTKLHGKPLKLEQYEFSQSLAIALDKSRFLLGTEWSLRLFDLGGNQLWQAAIPDVAWGVNISGDGKLGVAAFGDGTIRWYRMTDGKELLAFFPHQDRKRWVMWTPSGYYDASVGAEDFIGWHVNNSPDAAADWFPIGQFRDTYYRPDVIGKILQSGDEQLALKLANEQRGLDSKQEADIADMLPPVVEIISPSDGAKVRLSEMTVRYRLRSQTSEPVTCIMVLFDGKTATVERGLKLSVDNKGIEREIKIKIPTGASLLSILATNRFAPSVAATVRIITGQIRGPVVAGAVNQKSSAPKSMLFVVAIGVGKYTNGIPSLTYPSKDAKDFAAALSNQKGLRYRDVTVKVLPDATRIEMLNALEWISKVTTNQDVGMIFLSGHGVTDGSDFYYFLPSDANLEQLKATGVPFAEIENTLVSLKGQKVLFVDTCRSGAVLGHRGIIDINGIANKLNRETSGVAVFTASMGNENAEEDAEWGNGAFTRALLDGLNGQAAFNRSGEITFSMLDHFITKRVHELTANRQTPTATKPLTVPDFSLALAK